MTIKMRNRRRLQSLPLGIFAAHVGDEETQEDMRHEHPKAEVRGTSVVWVTESTAS